MPRFAANLSILFQEYSLLDRFKLAASAGFGAVEYPFPYDFPPDRAGRSLRDAGLSQEMFSLPAGEWTAGMRGMAALPGQEAVFAESVERALIYANALGCKKLQVMAGITGTRDRADCEAVFVANLRLAAQRFAEAGITALIEPVNSRDMPGYFLKTTEEALRILDLVSMPNLKLQFDIYHSQISGDDLTARLRQLAPVIGHIQIAGVPDRPGSELKGPDRGEVAYERLFPVIDEIGYSGCIGLEYKPAGDTLAGLGRMKAMGA